MKVRTGFFGKRRHGKSASDKGQEKTISHIYEHETNTNDKSGSYLCGCTPDIHGILCWLHHLEGYFSLFVAQ